MTAYLIGDVEITDADGFQAYREQVGAILDRFGARVLARGPAEVLEGEPLAGMVVLGAFETLDRLREWYASPDYAGALAIRLATTRSRLFGVDGAGQPDPSGTEKPGYVIGQITVTDSRAYEDYKPGARAAVDAFGGRFLVRGGEVAPLEGGPLGERIVIIEFSSVERALEWYNSPVYAEPRAIRQRASCSTVWIIESV